MIALDIGEAVNAFIQLKDLMEVGISFIIFGLQTGKSSERSSLQTKEFAGAFGEEKGNRSDSSRRLATNLEQLLGQGAEPTPFGGTTAAQDEFLNFLTGQANQRTSVRGLGPASAGDIAQNIAPSLMQFRQQGIENQAGRRDQDIQGLLELIGLAMPQIVGGQQTKGSSSQAGISLEGAGTIAGLCWVADVIYGVDAYETMCARLYASTADTLFLRLYKKFGKAWAKWLESHRWFIPVIKPIWDNMAKEGEKIWVGV